jgi:hypothetical protein
MEVRVRFELTVLRICNPLHWATLPSHYNLVLRDGIEPPSDAYKTPASPSMLTEQNLVDSVGLEPTSHRLRAEYNKPLYDKSIFGTAYGNRTRLFGLKGRGPTQKSNAV